MSLGILILSGFYWELYIKEVRNEQVDIPKVPEFASW